MSEIEKDMIRITSVDPGNAIITVFDDSSHTAIIEITVAPDLRITIDSIIRQYKDLYQYLMIQF